MAYYYNTGQRSDKDIYHRYKENDKYFTEALRAYIARSIRSKCCCQPPPCCCYRSCNCCCCRKKQETYKFIDYANASHSSPNLIEDKPQEKEPIVIATKANVSVQSSEITNINQSIVPSQLIEPELQEENYPIMCSCIKKTEICNSICPANGCFNFEKQIELNECKKNININVEVKVKKKKKNGDSKKCKCKVEEEEEEVMKPCVCKPNNTRPKSCIIHCLNKKCTCSKPKAITICCPVKESEDLEKCSCEPITVCSRSTEKSRILKILSNFRKSKESKSEDLDDSNVYVYAAKPAKTDDLSSVMKDIKSSQNNFSNGRHSSVIPLDNSSTGRHNSLTPSNAVKKSKSINSSTGKHNSLTPSDAIEKIISSTKYSSLTPSDAVKMFKSNISATGKNKSLITTEAVEKFQKILEDQQNKKENSKILNGDVNSNNTEATVEILNRSSTRHSKDSQRKSSVSK